MNSVAPQKDCICETQRFKTEVNDNFTEPQIELANPVQEQKRPTWRQLISDFAHSTSAHGIGRVAAAETYIRRGMWLLICLGVYTALFWYCVSLVIKYTGKPVISKVDIGFEESLDFPSITLCNMNALKLGNLREIKEIETQLDRFKQQQATPNSTGFERALNFTEQVKMEVLIAGAQSEEQREFYSGFEIDYEDALNQLYSRIIKGIPVEKLSQYGHTFDEMVKRCRWSVYRCDKGNLRKLWKHFWHWRFGNCYTFNSGRSNSGEKQEVLTTDDPGPKHGLQLDIFVDQSQYTANTQDAGIRVVIHDQGIMPFPDEQGFSVPTGLSTIVGIRKTRVQRVDPFQNRSCSVSTDEASKTADNKTHSSDIYEQKYHVRYSPETCRKSCLARKEQELCNCTESKFPIVNSSACTTFEQVICLKLASRKYLKKGGLCYKKCPLLCRDDQFQYTVSSTQWSTRFKTQMEKLYQGPKGKLLRQTLGENFLRVKIFYQDFRVDKVIYEENYTIANLLADIGGQLGLWVGVSLLTVTELVELILSLFRLVVKKIRWTSRKK